MPIRDLPSPPYCLSEHRMIQTGRGNLEFSGETGPSNNKSIPSQRLAQDLDEGTVFEQIPSDPSVVSVALCNSAFVPNESLQ